MQLLFYFWIKTLFCFFTLCGSFENSCVWSRLWEECFVRSLCQHFTACLGDEDDVFPLTRWNTWSHDCPVVLAHSQILTTVRHRDDWFDREGHSRYHLNLGVIATSYINKILHVCGTLGY